MLKSLKRWPVLLALLVAFAPLAVGLLLPHGGRVTCENCERIKEGMTEAEVRAILGKPWDDSLFDPERPSMVVELQGPIWKYSRQWVGDDCEIFVTFDDNGRVMNRVLASARRPRSSVPYRVWRRLCEWYGW
jgi:outer membrane protein assembly factor BamE (lipoprotein component of BamABCDE complex)